MTTEANEPQSAADILRDIAERVEEEEQPPDDTEASETSTGLVIMRHLPVPLTNERKLVLLDDITGHVKELNRLEEHKKSMNAEISKAMKHRRTEMDNLAQVVAQGAEMRMVSCRKEVDYVKGTIKITRLDTGKVLEDRPLIEEDMK